MNSFIFFTFLCVIFYYIHKWYPQYLEKKYYYYFGGFILIYLFIMYMFTYENEFMYKLFKNIHDTNRQPLHAFNAKDSNSELYNNLNPNTNIKIVLAQKQNQRCIQCKNYILNKDIDYYKLKYIVPLQNGGQNDINNLSIVCPSCIF